ncbi:hypothetical protein CRG98_005682 [Punica granatum]|uniref:Uncharacterized protein n=1 Tax=Punica granatum TaxID=22663 RepID=A0A2I0KZL8_PUNGR|nr:hypothetical protein CRG98_005682 [Punica granatum]
MSIDFLALWGILSFGISVQPSLRTLYQLVENITFTKGYEWIPASLGINILSHAYKEVHILVGNRCILIHPLILYGQLCDGALAFGDNLGYGPVDLVLVITSPSMP